MASSQNSFDLKQENSFNTKIKGIVNEFTVNKVPEKDIKFFVQSITNILQDETENLVSYYQETNYISNTPVQNTNLPNYSSKINIFLVPNTMQNRNTTPNYQYPQTYSNYSMIPNYAASPYQNQFYPQVQPFQQNAYYNAAQPNMLTPQPPQTEEKKSKKTKSKKEKKEKKEKKDKKSSKKKETKKEKIPKDSNIKEFQHQGGEKFDGICNYLTNKTGGNIYDNGTINITSNNISKLNGFVDYKCDYNGSSSSSGDTFICFDFKANRVKLTSYSILSFFNSSGSGQIKNWALEVSEDGQNWTEIDRRVNDSTLNHAGVRGIFQIQSLKKKFYQYIRIRQTGEGWDSSDRNDFGFNGIEFYGFIKEN